MAWYRRKFYVFMSGLPQPLAISQMNKTHHASKRCSSLQELRQVKATAALLKVHTQPDLAY
jgi:hypothetical protein